MTEGRKKWWENLSKGFWQKEERLYFKEVHIH